LLSFHKNNYFITHILPENIKILLKEHQKAVSTLDKGKSALAEHVCYTKHEIAWENSKVITTNNRYGQRLCLEAWHMNMSNHALNRDDGAYLPEEYMHLIGR
jgi:hypothetical protein